MAWFSGMLPYLKDPPSLKEFHKLFERPARRGKRDADATGKSLMRVLAIMANEPLPKGFLDA